MSKDLDKTNKMNPCKDCVVLAMCQKSCSNHIDYVSIVIKEYNFSSSDCTEISYFMKENYKGEFLFFDGHQTLVAKPSILYKAIRLNYNSEGEILSVESKY